MAKLGDFKTPTGASGNIFDINSWIGLILGTLVLFITFGMGQKLSQKVDGKLGIDTTIEQPYKSMPSVTNNTPARNVY